MESSSVTTKAHLPCPDCGSHDAMSEYSDGHTYCFSCETHHSASSGQEKKSAKKSEVLPTQSLTLDHLKARGITKETCAKYGYYKASFNGNPVHIACYFNDIGELEGQKIRTKDKDFYTKGHVSDRFFGQHLFPGGGKKLVITEGEIDCLTVSQIQQNKYPVVSVPCGAKSAEKTFKTQIHWLESFEEVIVMFDMDKVGQEAVKSVEGILSPGKLKIAYLPLKDPNQCLLAGKPDTVVQAIWNAKTYKPDGIINGADLWDELNTQDQQVESWPFPWNIDLQNMTLGIRPGEMIMLTAGTGVGKSTIARKISYHLGVNLNVKVGLMMLEENKKRTAKDLMSDFAGKRLRILWDTLSEQERKITFDKTLGTGNFVIYDHFGSIEGQNLLKKMRYMVAEGCSFIVLDHISIAVSGLEGNDERRIIDRLMTQLRSLIEETGIGMIVISHLRKTEGQTTTHEEGGTITLDQLRGSGTLKQIPDTIIAGERNQQAQGKEKNLVRLRLLKCRFTGETGIAGYLCYNKETDGLEPVEKLSDYIQEHLDLGSEEDAPF